MEIIANSMRGIYRDILKGENNNIIYDSGWVSNTIVNTCRMLLAGFMKNDPAYGIAYLAVGQGQATWDSPPGPPTPDPEETTHLDEGYAPVMGIDVLTLEYLDEYDTVVTMVTNRLQITADLEPGYPAPILPLNTYPLREFGLFGGMGTADYMINCIRHPVIHKGPDETLNRVIRLYF